MARMKYRLALDVGANSLGWCVYRLDANDEPDAVARMGARIFSDGRDPKTLASKAAERRLARQARRRRDRVLKRRHRLMDGLVHYGLMPEDEAARKALQLEDPYVLRARGLDEALTPGQLGRALYHLARKRGFRSSRKDARDPDSEKETGKVHAAIAALKVRVGEAGCRTVGEYLARQHRERLPVRARRSNDGQYVLYLQRDMVAEEFDALWEAQRRHHSGLLTEEARHSLRDTMLFQRRLLPVRPGRCLFEPDEHRARLCAPLQQRFRILQEVNNLRIKDGLGQRPLSLDERDRMQALLLQKSGLVTFAQLAKAAGLRNATEFNLARDEKRRGLKGDTVTASFASDTAFGASWHDLPEETKYALAVLVEQAERTEELVGALTALPDNLAPAREILGKQHDTEAVLKGLAALLQPVAAERAKAMAAFKLPDDYGSLSLKTLRRIVPELERDVVTYDVAVQRAGYQHHSDLYDGVLHDRLPYYGEILRGYTAPADKAKDSSEKQYGKIPNPTVHIGLNQVRQLVNALIGRYGRPHQIVVELTREFGASGERRREIMKRQAENQDRNERYNAALDRLSVRINRENRMKMQLWEEIGRDDAMDRYCIYSGQRLSLAALFSDEIEIDHILPFSRSLHDGIGNKILCIRQGNRDKGNRTPFEAFGHTSRWDGILERASRLPGNKALLFRENALESFLDGKDFLDRHLTDTAYLGRVTKQYLGAVCPPNCIWVSSGRLTGLVRGKFGLSRLLSEDGTKNREDHRHHALDAAVIGLCSRSLIKRLADAAARAEGLGEQRLLEGLALPWPTYRDDLQTCLSKVVVSHKPDRGRQAALHNDTNYGLRDGPDKSGNPLVARRVPIETLGSAADTSGIVDDLIRAELAALLAPLSGGKEVKAALLEYSRRTGIKRVLKQEWLSVIPIHDRRTGVPYRYVKGDANHCCEIFQRPDGRWDGDVISVFEANQKAYVESSAVAQNGMPLVMRLHKDDIVAIEDAGCSRLLRVAKMSKGRIEMVDVNDARKRDKSAGFRYYTRSPGALQSLRARGVGVDILGYVNDRGARSG